MENLVLSSGLHKIGRWGSAEGAACFSAETLQKAIAHFRSPAYVIRESGDSPLGIGLDGQLLPVDGIHTNVIAPAQDEYLCFGVIPALYPEWLGDRSFLETHGMRFPYVAGAMARAITSEAMVIEMSRAGMLAFFGAGGLSLQRVESALDTLEQELGDDSPWGCNLIHSPQDPELEKQLVDLLLRRRVRRVSASAFMSLTPAVVRYAFANVRRDENGHIQRSNHLFAKISRPEVATHFMSPPPSQILDTLVRTGGLNSEEAKLASELPVAEDITVESDSGGHTDNRPLGALFPTIAHLRDQLVAKYQYARSIRLGAAGGLGTPAAVAAAFGLGAAYVLTGSVNQSCREANISSDAKAMLAEAEMADTDMCPSADMFELGAKVQVLKRGTMFASRASTLYALYNRYESLDAIPQEELSRVEQQILRQPVEEVWRDVRDFFKARDPRELERAEKNPKHRMALVFRSYLGRSSTWPIDGIKDRQLDYQLWCGPALGAFNVWVKGSFLEQTENRTVVQVALNLLEGAAHVTRALQFRSFGIPVPAQAFHFRPRRLSVR